MCPGDNKYILWALVCSVLNLTWMWHFLWHIYSVRSISLFYFNIFCLENHSQNHCVKLTQILIPPPHTLSLAVENWSQYPPPRPATASGHLCCLNTVINTPSTLKSASGCIASLLQPTKEGVRLRNCSDWRTLASVFPWPSEHQGLNCHSTK